MDSVRSVLANPRLIGRGFNRLYYRATRGRFNPDGVDVFDPELDFQYADRHPADAEHTHPDTSKAQELLGYEPRYRIREGVSSFIEWYKNNRDWYEPLVRAS